jgi:ketosteroid isomerase-like protein
MRSRDGAWRTKVALLGLLLTTSLVACSSGGDDSAAQQALKKQADMFAIGQIERKWHQASSTQDVELMMSLWADDATFTVSGQTYTGKTEIRDFFVNQAGPFQPGNHWVSDSPAYKQRVTVSGNTGTLYFECDYIDLKTQKVVAVVSADQDVARIGGTWLITNSVAATPDLSAGY